MPIRFFVTALLLLPPCFGAGIAHSIDRRDFTSACDTISKTISSASSVIYPSDVLQAAQFQSDIQHWYGTSTQTPACVVEVGSPEDTAAVMQVVSSTQTPFAVRSGGHTSNPGFSSTTGVHISMTKLKQLQFSPDNSTLELGMGWTWSDVYSQIQSSGVNVVGGRTVGPGVGGFTLGGGFSWKTQQFGLTCDTVKSFNVVFPNATIGKIDSSQSDMFFALKGGLNRFGIVTSAEYFTHEQPPTVYGGLATYGTSEVPAVLNATNAFGEIDDDPKAQIITTLEGGTLGTTALVLFFYDGPTRPPSFAPFDDIPTELNLVSSQSFSDFVSIFQSGLVTNPRGTFNTLSTTKLTPGFLSAVSNATDSLGKIMALHSGTSISFDVEPFFGYGQHATDSAYPHADSPLPLNLYFAWTSPADDQFWYDTMRSTINDLKEVALKEGIFASDFTAYPNYAISNTTTEDLYGAANAARLKSIKQQVDPTNVMGLAGGFAI